MKKRIILAMLLLVFLTSCSGSMLTGNVVREVPHEDEKSIDVFFCPRDNCTEQLVEVIESAENSVHCAFFDLDLEPVINVLSWKSASIDVKLVVDNQYYGELDYLGFARKDTTSQYMHNKFCIIDDKTITTGSFNPTYNGAYKNNNNLIIIKSVYLAENYESEFTELWGGIFGRGGKVKSPIIFLSGTEVESYFCPEDSCADKIIGELREAEESIYFMTFSFTHRPVANQLILAKERGIDVKGVFEKTQKSKYSVFELLDFQGINVTWDSNPGKLHHKVFIIDSETVITGSMNPSKNGDENNDENVLIVHDEEIAGMFMREFDILT